MPTARARAVLKCPKCPSKFSGTGNLNIHMKQHGKPGMKLCCPHCDYSSNRDDYMSNHIDDHLGKKGEREVTSGTKTAGRRRTSTKPSAASSATHSGNFILRARSVDSASVRYFANFYRCSSIASSANRRSLCQNDQRKSTAHLYADECHGTSGSIRIFLEMLELSLCHYKLHGIHSSSTLSRRK